MTKIRSYLLTAVFLLTATAAYPQATMVTTGDDHKPRNDFDISGSHIIGFINRARLGTGTPTATNYLRGDGTWSTPAGSGNTSTFDASVITSGVFSTTHLGTGTPSSATVLRGDGTWAGTTSTGNTVASTASLLMGDSTGNAAAVARSSDLGRILQMRADTASALSGASANLISGSGLMIRAGTVNPDGTITIPAGDYVGWTTTDTVALPHYAYAVAAADTPVGNTNGFYVIPYCNGYQTIPETNLVSTNPAPGVSKCAFINQDGYGLGHTDYAIYVVNSTSAPVTIYPPVCTVSDVGVQLASSFADHVAVQTQPVADLDFTRFSSADRSGRSLAERQTTLALDSVSGSNANAGTLYAPKTTLAGQTIGNGSVVGLYRGSVFRDSLPLSTIGLTHGIAVQDVALGSVKALPVVSALDAMVAQSITPNGDSTCAYHWTPGDSTISNGGYSNVYVVEINTATEAATPIASRRRMIDVTSQSACAATAGSAWVLPPGTGTGQSGSTTQWKVNFHPTDSQFPGSGSSIYRYEVVSRVQPANWGSFDANPGDGLMSGLVLVGGSSGYGALGGPPNFVGDRLAFIHATTHNAVIGGGSLQRSVFYESGDIVAPGPSIQLAWYAGQGAGLRWDLRQCLFYANVGDRYANGLISHTNGTLFDRGDISDCAFIGGRWSDGSLNGTAIDYVNVAAGTINRVYMQGIASPFGGNMPTTAEVKNCVFRQVNSTQISGSFHDNIVVAEGLLMANDPQYRNATGFSLTNASGVVSNNLFWSRGLTAAVTDIQVVGFSASAAGTATRDIIVIDPATPATQAKYFANAPASGTTLDYNLVICTGAFTAAGPNGGYTSFPAYRTGTGLDQHSLYVDLSADPRGLRAVFADPVNGDFRWAQTDVARRCAAYCRLNHVGPATVTSRWPVVPTVDEAVRLLTAL